MKAFSRYFTEEEAIIISTKDPISKDKKMYTQFMLKIILLIVLLLNMTT